MSGVSVDQLRRHWQERIPFNRLCGFVVSRWDDTGVRMVAPVDGLHPAQLKGSGVVLLLGR